LTRCSTALSGVCERVAAVDHTPGVVDHTPGVHERALGRAGVEARTLVSSDLFDPDTACRPRDLRSALDSAARQRIYSAD
jgi:hypothetical protein